MGSGTKTGGAESSIGGRPHGRHAPWASETRMVSTRLLEAGPLDDRRPTIRARSASDVLAASVFFVLVLGGLLLCLEVAYNLIGTAGVVLGVVFFPVLLLTAPWYALFALGHPLPAILCYGGAIIGWALVSFGGEGLRRFLRGW